MVLISVFAVLVLLLYLLLCYVSFGITDMVSDTYYKLETVSRGKGNMFSIVMFIVGVAMMVCLLDSGEGVQCLAFIGAAGLIIVSIAPNFKDIDTHTIHKAGAIISAIGTISWCLSVNVYPTITLFLMFCVYCIICNLNAFFAKVFHMNNTKVEPHYLYWAEAIAFANVFITYWILMYQTHDIA